MRQMATNTHNSAKLSVNWTVFTVRVQNMVREFDYFWREKTRFMHDLIANKLKCQAHNSNVGS